MSDNNTSAADPFSRIVDEFAEAVRQGRDPSVEEFARRYPAHADRIRGMLPALLLKEQAETAIDTPGQVRPADGPGAGAPPHLANYEILDEVGRGGMGVVYRARDLTLDREVAVKVLLEHYAPTSGTAARFLNEARITGQLQHPGIPAVYQVGALADGRPFMAMKLIKGQTLEASLRAGTPVDSLAVFEAIGQAVGYAHAHGVIHRDLKPSNVMVGAFGEVQVMDWGLGKMLTAGVGTCSPDAPADPDLTRAETAVGSRGNSDGTFTQAGSVLGTPAYMSPEQAAGEVERIGSRSDVFGLGAILCVLLTGRPPFEGKTFESVRLNAVRGKTEEAFTRLDACGADPGAVELCKRCLAFDPARRPASGDEVAAAVAALRRAADERARQAEQDRLAAQVRTAEQAKRRRVVERAAAAVIVVLAGGVAVSLWQARRAGSEARRADEARSEAEGKREEAEKAYSLARESLVQVGSDLPDVLRQAIYTRDAQRRANQVLADALAKQLDPTAVRGLPGRARLALHVRAGDVQAELGQRAEAEAHYKAALEVSTQLLHAGGSEAAFAKGNHALVLTKLAVAERDGRRTAETANTALARLAEVEQLQRELLADPPPDRSAAELRQSLANTLLERATTFRSLQRYDQALEPCREAIELLRPGPDDPTGNRYLRGRKATLASALGQLAQVQLARQDDLAAEATLREAVTVSAEVLKDDPRNPLSRLSAARAARELGDFLLMRNRLDESEEYYSQDVASFRALLGTGELLALRFELGDVYYRSATLALKRKDGKTAADHYARCRNLWQEVAEVNPTPRNKLAVALAQARLGEHEAAAAFPRRLLAERGHSLGDGIQAVSVLALCGAAAAGNGRRKYLDESLAGLTRLVDELGYRNVARLKTDPDLDPLRDDPAFHALVQKLDAGPSK